MLQRATEYKFWTSLLVFVMLVFYCVTLNKTFAYIYISFLIENKAELDDL